MSMRGYVLGLAAAAIVATAFFAAPASAAASSDDTVIAIVNGDKIKKKDVMNAIKQLPKQQTGDTKEIFPYVVDQIINEKLIDDATTQAKIEDSEEFKKQLDAVKGQLAKQIYVEKMLKSKLSDAAVKAEYNKFRDENKGKKEIHARHLLVKTEEEAKQAIKDLGDGAKFEDLVKQRSSDTVSAHNGGDLGWFAKEDMLPEFSDAAFKLKPGEFSKAPVKTQFGWHVIKVEDVRDRQIPDMKQVEGPIRQQLAKEALHGLIVSLRTKADIQMFDLEGKPLAFGNSKGKKGDKPAKEDKPAGDTTKD